MIPSALLCLALFSAQVSDELPDSTRAAKVLNGNDWYDSATQSLRPPTDLNDPDIALRSSDWLAKPKTATPPAAKKSPSSSNTNTWRWFGNWFGGFDSQLLNYLLIVALACVLVIGMLILYRQSFQAWIPGRFRRPKNATSVAVDMTRVVDLPFEVKTTRRDPLAEAESLMNAGRYGEAIIFLFGYLLLALDQFRYIRLQRGKTNRMYLREITSQQELRAIVQRTMLAFEDVFFGRYNLSRERFMEVWEQMETFHQLIHPDVDQASPPKVASR